MVPVTTSSVRVWKRPHVTAGKRYRMEGGEIEVDSIDPITFDDITPELDRACGLATSAISSRRETREWRERLSDPLPLHSE